ncbi:hypothetical protein HDU76_001076 [Blyttiomyces sp. JEL0837]|nr:hypothetical protein HDU76_001076 [Blyttiomyces sp. JEL0837]
MFMVIDLMMGGDLRYHLDRIGGFKESAVRGFAAELVCGIEYLHRNKVVHRDLKPDNVLLDADGHAHLTDFNIAVRYDNRKYLKSHSGTIAYMAPEIFGDKGYLWQIDWWSLGVVLYECIFGKRLGCNVERGEKEIFEHPWFAGIDWKVVEDKRMVPGFVPGTDRPNFDASYDLEELLMAENPLTHKPRKKKTSNNAAAANNGNNSTGAASKRQQSLDQDRSLKAQGRSMSARVGGTFAHFANKGLSMGGGKPIETAEEVPAVPAIPGWTAGNGKNRSAAGVAGAGGSASAATGNAAKDRTAAELQFIDENFKPFDWTAAAKTLQRNGNGAGTTSGDDKGNQGPSNESPRQQLQPTPPPSSGGIAVKRGPSPPPPQSLHPSNSTPPNSNSIPGSVVQHHQMTGSQHSSSEVLHTQYQHQQQQLQPTPTYTHHSRSGSNGNNGNGTAAALYFPGGNAIMQRTISSPTPQQQQQQQQPPVPRLPNSFPTNSPTPPPPSNSTSLANNNIPPSTVSGNSSQGTIQVSLPSSVISPNAPVNSNLNNNVTSMPIRSQKPGGSIAGGGVVAAAAAINNNINQNRFPTPPPSPGQPYSSTNNTINNGNRDRDRDQHVSLATLRATAVSPAPNSMAHYTHVTSTNNTPITTTNTTNPNSISPIPQTTSNIQTPTPTPTFTSSNSTQSSNIYHDTNNIVHNPSSQLNSHQQQQIQYGPQQTSNYAAYTYQQQRVNQLHLATSLHYIRSNSPVPLSGTPTPPILLQQSQQQQVLQPQSPTSPNGHGHGNMMGFPFPNVGSGNVVTPSPSPSPSPSPMPSGGKGNGNGIGNIGYDGKDGGLMGIAGDVALMGGGGGGGNNNGGNGGGFRGLLGSKGKK